MSLLNASPARLIEDAAEPFTALEDADLQPLLDRIGNKRVVLIGEASHGTSEFYRMRQRMTQLLIQEKGFNLVTAEADWPDSEHVDDYVRSRDGKTERPREAFSRFPLWMWRNAEFLGFIDWLRGRNRIKEESSQTSFHGLDLYSLFNSIHEVIEYLQREKPELVDHALERYRSLLAYEPDPFDYSRAVMRGEADPAASEVAGMLRELLEKRMAAARERREPLFDAEQNARVVANAEEYYREVYQGARNTWNLRDSHMLETLRKLLELRSDGDSKAVVWAHNSHIGDARGTEMSRRGEHNLGQLARETFSEEDCHLIGFGTHEGTVAAADNWGEQVKMKKVRPSLAGSIERVCHESRHGNFILPLAGEAGAGQDLSRSGRFLERAIGVIYRPDTERFSHYFETDIGKQFDEYVWFDTSRAISPLNVAHAPDLPACHPFVYKD